MFKNYLKIFFQTFKKNKLNTFLNILGLSLGLAIVFLILAFVSFETSFDLNHKKADRIYRILRIRDDLDWKEPGLSKLLPEILENEYPEIEKVAQTRIIGVELFNDENYERAILHCVDKEIFEIMTLPLVKGSLENALIEPYDILISETRRDKYFPNEDPIGKTLRFKLYGEEIDFTVKGVIKDVPDNCTFAMPFLVNLEISDKFFQFIDLRYGSGKGVANTDNWYANYYQTYILLKKGIDAKAFEVKLNEVSKHHKIDQFKVTYELQSVKDIYLKSNDLTNNSTRSGSLSRVYIFLTIGILILFIACTNFILLSTAQSTKRSKEIAMKKISGASSFDIIKQLLFESVLTSLFASIIALIMAHFLKIGAVKLIYTFKNIEVFTNVKYLSLFFIVTFFTGIVSGLYISLKTLKSKPINILKNQKTLTGRRSYFRIIVTTLQMIIFISLLSSSIIIYKQLEYVRNGDFGFNKEQILSLDLNNFDFSDNYDAFVQELKRNPNIINCAGASELPPSDNKSVTQVQVFDDPETDLEVLTTGVDYEFFETFDIKLSQGKFFERGIESASDSTQKVIVNETAVRNLHIKDPIGKTVNYGKIVGVIKDYHQHSLYNDISPQILYLHPAKYFSSIAIKISPNNVNETISFIEETWKNFTKGSEAVFDYHFIDDRIDNMYWESIMFGKAIIFSTFVAIFIACLGLLGLTLFITEQKSKDIAIRKICGASIGELLRYLSKEIVIINIIATIIAIPIIIYAMNLWLSNFTMKTSINYFIFVFSGLIALLISLLTMSFITIRASLVNPSEKLKYE